VEFVETEGDPFSAVWWFIVVFPIFYVQMGFCFVEEGEVVAAWRFPDVE